MKMTDGGKTRARSAGRRICGDLARAARFVTYAESRHHLTEDRSYFYRIDGQEAREG